MSAWHLRTGHSLVVVFVPNVSHSFFRSFFLLFSLICQHDIWGLATLCFKCCFLLSLICQHDIWGLATLWFFVVVVVVVVPNMSAWHLTTLIPVEWCEEKFVIVSGGHFCLFTESLRGSWCCSTIWPIVSYCFSLGFLSSFAIVELWTERCWLLACLPFA